MKLSRLISKNNLAVSEVLIHILGPDEATYLSIAQEYYLKSNKAEFKMPIASVTKNYGMTRHKQLTCLEFLSDNNIIESEPSMNGVSDGKDYKFVSETMSELNYIISMAEDVRGFRDRLDKKMVRGNLDLDIIIERLGE
jgi:hypothetical protein